MLMRVLAVSGNRKTGKTTTIIRLIQEYSRRGISVATIKNSHCLNLDPAEIHTDTDKHLQAGAMFAGLHNPGKTVFIPSKFNLYKPDFLILEGFRELTVPRIFTGRTLADITSLEAKNALAICGPVCDFTSEVMGTKALDCFLDITQLADLLCVEVPEITESTLFKLLERVYKYERKSGKANQKISTPSAVLSYKLFQGNPCIQTG